MAIKSDKIMKKTTLLFTILAFSFATYAQNGFQLGLQVSPNFSWIKPDSDGTESDGIKFGFNYGLIGDFNIADNYAVSTGLFLTNYGGKINYPDIQEVGGIGALQGRTEADIRTKYIEIPLTLKLKTNEIGYMKYFGQFGFGFGYNFESTADTKFNSPGGSTISEEDVDFDDEINSLRVGLIVGLGAEYNLSGNTSLLFGVTFNNGFTNILSKDTYPEDQNGDAMGNEKNANFKAINNSILLNVGVLF